ncbi:TetR/AcrR family transcriptional regulator [Rhizobium terrae]|uniref:TetR/AcrR family transcriptional regulator n=1 Tax=Rhizobium terrae TaxID=2171756 RepID=UPI000E3BFAC8|nr:TetR/AcrR family transcriptional regulator [Rhizobium terrae]
MSETKKRGRPRAFDEAATIEKAREVFWDRGFEGTSLDALSAATSLNRPSLYGAFGDKEDLYLGTLAGYRDDSLVAMEEALDPSLPLRENIAEIYRRALSTYLSGETSARGCFLIGTATAEAIQHSRVRDMLRQSLEAFDAEIEARLMLAVERGELPKEADPKALSLLASSVMHSLAVRARAGAPRDMLEDLARAGVDMVCGRAPQK